MMISYSEFSALPVEKQALVLDELRKEHGVGNLVKMWGISTSRLYHLIHELNLPVSKRGRKAKSNKKSTATNKTGKESAQAVKPAPVTAEVSKLTLSLTAEGEGDTLLGRLQPLFTSMAAAHTKFKVSVILEEI